MFSSEFSTCNTVLKHGEFGFKDKKVKVHGHIHDVYTVVIKRY